MKDARCGKPVRRNRSACAVVALSAALAVAVLLQASGDVLKAAVNFDEADGKYTLILLRHGESQWNLENRFTGWVDVDVSPKGAEEAANAGKLIKEANITVDKAFTSYQKRAIKTLNLALEEMDSLWIPVTKSWKLNERMYGDLQGMNKVETTQKHGEEKVKTWRRSYDVPPPEISDDNPYHPKLDPKYQSLSKKELPLTESLALTIKRVIPFWKSSIVPELKQGNTIVIAAHGNSIRALVKYLDNIPEDVITELNIPTAIPLVYRLNRWMKPVELEGHAPSLSGVYLGDPEWVASKIDGVKNQAKR